MECYSFTLYYLLCYAIIHLCIILYNYPILVKSDKNIQTPQIHQNTGNDIYVIHPHNKSTFI